MLKAPSGIQCVCVCVCVCAQENIKFVNNVKGLMDVCIDVLTKLG